jgi:acyl-coenzyme A thioesterase PaaI-like protein
MTRQEPPIASSRSRIPLPWTRSCFVCGEENPEGLRARCFKAGNEIELPFVARRAHAGWSGVLHGGLIATVLDEVMTWAAIVGSRKACFAADFSVRLLKPLPPETSCLAVARLSEARRRIFDTEAWLRSEEGTVFARATGRYMPVQVDQLSELRRDLVRCEGCLDLGPIFEG